MRTNATMATNHFNQPMNVGPGKDVEGNSFNACTAEVEILLKHYGMDLTYMKFVFQSPIVEIVAPVLENIHKTKQAVKQNTPCVFRENRRIFQPFFWNMS